MIHRAGMVVLAIMATAVGASAQSTQAFNEGGFTVSYPAQWIQAGPGDVARGQALLAVRPQGPSSVDAFTQCSVRRSMHSGRQSQAALNSNVAGWTAESIRDGARSARVVRFSNERLGNVQVATLVDEFTEPATGQVVRTYERHFALPRGGQFASFFLWCGVSMPRSERELADVEAFVGSLTFPN